MDFEGMTSGGGGGGGSCGGMLAAAIITLVLFGIGLFGMNWALSDFGDTAQPTSSEQR